MKLAPRFTPRSSWLWPAAALSLLGCPNEELAPVGPCTVSGVFDTITQNANDEVDLLFMVDNSGSMKEEQVNLAKQLPRLVSILASGKLTDAAGMVVREFPPVKSLHLGVVSSDMGVNGLPPAKANDVKCPGVGDDGLLLSTASDAMGCAGKTFPNAYLEFTAGVSDAAALGTDFGCITNLGTTGCGFEQQLESMWKALAPSKDTSFSGGTSGHGDAENVGFLRDDSVIAVIQVSDEEDCSSPDSSRVLFDADDDSSRLNVKCQLNPMLQHPASRYVNGLKSLRPENADQVIFAAIVGVPKEAEGMVKDGLQDFDGILGLPEMEFMTLPPDMAGNVYAKPSCETASGKAYPPRRFVEVAKGFGKNGIIRSICQEDFSSALSAIIDKIADQLQGACLDRTLVADPTTEMVACGLVEYLGSKEKACDPNRGRQFLEMRKDDKGNDRIVCRLNQLAVDKKQASCQIDPQMGATLATGCLKKNPGTDPDNPKVTDAIVGWYYDDFSAELKKNPQCNSQRIAFTEGAEQIKGSEVRFECLQPVFSVFAQPKGVDAVNKPCKEAKDKTICTNAKTDEYTLACDPTRDTCQIQCGEDANCPDGWVCEQTGGICLNPTCPPQ